MTDSDGHPTYESTVLAEKAKNYDSGSREVGHAHSPSFLKFNYNIARAWDTPDGTNCGFKAFLFAKAGFLFGKND